MNIDKWDGIVPPECQPNPKILRLNAKLSWEEAKEPLHIDIDLNKACGVGPGLAFANAVRRMGLGIKTVGLVPCAVGGTNISEWSRGMPLYNDLVKRVKASMVEGGKVRAILWYQGESDTILQADAEAYKKNLERFILDLRADLQFPTTPIIQVALATAQGPYIEIVRQAQLGLRLPYVWCVDAKGLKIEADYVHLSTPAQVKLGQMLAQEFVKTLQNPVAVIHSIASGGDSQLSQHFFVWKYFLVCVILLLI